MSNTKETTLSVDGMTCSSCVRHVEGALRKVDGVGSVDVNIKGAKVCVHHDPEIAVDELIRALSDAGYESRAAGRDP